MNKRTFLISFFASIFVCSAMGITCENGYHSVVSGGGGGSLQDVILDAPGVTNQNDIGTWTVNYGEAGTLTGEAGCASSSSVSNPSSGFDVQNWDDITTLDSDAVTPVNTQGSSNGFPYCFCRLTGYTPDGGETQTFSSQKWVFGYNQVNGCFSACASFCSSNMKMNQDSQLRFRHAVLASVEASSETCEPNIINIAWNGTTPTAIQDNEAASVTYGGDIRTPKSANQYPGKRFLGWQFSTMAPQ